MMIAVSFGFGIAVLAGLLVAVEVANHFLGVWADRMSDARRRRREERPRFPWSDRTGT